VDRWCGAGGIRWLLDLIEEHPGPLEYDWRTRFGTPLASVGGVGMSWGEAFRLVGELLRDPSSHVAAALGGWDYPWTWEAAVTADLYDLTLTVNTSRKSKRESYPRPWPTVTPQGARRRGDAAGRDPDEVRALLARMRDGAIEDGR